MRFVHAGAAGSRKKPSRRYCWPASSSTAKADRGTLHRNAAARNKSRLMKRLNALKQQGNGPSGIAREPHVARRRNGASTVRTRGHRWDRPIGLHSKPSGRCPRFVRQPLFFEPWRDLPTLD